MQNSFRFRHGDTSKSYLSKTGLSRIYVRPGSPSHMSTGTCICGLPPGRNKALSLEESRALSCHSELFGQLWHSVPSQTAVTEGGGIGKSRRSITQWLSGTPCGPVLSLPWLVCPLQHEKLLLWFLLGIRSYREKNSAHPGELRGQSYQIPPKKLSGTL